MKTKTKKTALTLTVLTLAVMLPAPFHAFGLDRPSGKKIITLVHDRADGDDRASIVTMTLINKNGRKRVREMEQHTTPPPESLAYH